MDRDSLVAVAEDLEYLASWGQGDVSDGEIRRGTAVLRRLLVEDAYGCAWREIGQLKQPTLLAVDLDLLLGDNAPRVHLALAGGALCRGMSYAAVLVHKGAEAIGKPPPSPIRENGYPFERSFTLNEYLKSPSGVVDGLPFTRREVIKYIANVKGGVHLSAKQRKEEAKLVSRLGKAEKKMMVQMSDGLLLEAFAIGQSLGASQDAKVYVQLAAKV